MSSAILSRFRMRIMGRAFRVFVQALQSRLQAKRGERSGTRILGLWMRPYVAIGGCGGYSNLLATTNLRATSLPRSGTSRPRACYRPHTRNSRHEVPIHLLCCGCIAPSARLLQSPFQSELDQWNQGVAVAESDLRLGVRNPCLPALNSMLPLYRLPPCAKIAAR